jgi:hypothetical protein
METISEAVKTSSQIPQGFKDLIARRCEDKGIIFRYTSKKGEVPSSVEKELRYCVTQRSLENE